ncbi:MAG: DNA/RNA non-specific endonuclease [Bacteroidales bacterium]|nr:DNA/RNA non-specific endonuclease [Candidatus Sodaliphilus limicaballi]
MKKFVFIVFAIVSALLSLNFLGCGGGGTKVAGEEQQLMSGHTPSQEVSCIDSLRDEWKQCGLPKNGNSLQGKELARKGYVSSYNPETLQPNWVAWKLTAGHVGGECSRSGYGYLEDEEVEPRQTYDDWADASSLGYDHGHMCPAGDNKWSQEAMAQTFLLTNMCPQAKNLNQHSWERLERSCRKWAERLGEIYIVCGPVFRSSNHKMLGNGKIPVPDAFYKVILYAGDQPRAIGFVYDNVDPPKGDNMKDHVVPISEIEAITGITFFPELPQELSQRLKAVDDFKQWNKF